MKACRVPAGDAAGVVSHLLQRHGKRGFSTLQRHAERVAHQQDIHASGFEQGSKTRVVAGQDGNFFALVGHLLQGVQCCFQLVKPFFKS